MRFLHLHSADNSMYVCADTIEVKNQYANLFGAVEKNI